MPIGLVAAGVTAAGVVGGAAISSSAASDAANAQTNASNAALGLQQQQFNTTQANLQPLLQTSSGALGKLSTLYGINPGTGGASSAYNANLPGGGASGGAGSAPAATVTDLYHQLLGRDPDASGLAYFSKMPLAQAQQQIMGGQEYQTRQASGNAAPYLSPNATPATTAPGYTNAAGGGSTVDPNADFYLSPDYNFKLTQGLNGITTAAAAGSGTDNGATRKAEIGYAGDLATSNYDDYKNGLMTLAGLGTSANSVAATSGQNNVNSQGALLTNQGNSLASSYLGQGAIGAKTLTGLASTVGQNSGAISNYLGTSTGAAGDNGNFTNYGGYNVTTGF